MSNNEQITSVTRRLFAELWHNTRETLSTIELHGHHSRFVVTRRGFTGSTWLAKLVNSHPDVNCSHERILGRIFPRRSYDNEDIIGLIRLLATDTMHDAYLAAGDVGSVWLLHAIELHGKFTTAVLMRHPARVLHSRLCRYPSDQSFAEVPPYTAQVFKELWDVNIDEVDPLNRVFLHDLLTYATQVQVLDRVDSVLRIEDLQDVDYCQDALHHLTGVFYEADLVARAIGQRVNAQTDPNLTVPAILGGLTANQKHWYHTILDDVAPFFGYDLESGAVLQGWRPAQAASERYREDRAAPEFL